MSETFAGLQAWRLVTFQFLHGSLLHLGMNCLGLWVFGSMVERRLGKARTLALYLVCGFGGAFGFVLLFATGIVRATSTTPLIGASAGVFGLIAAAMRLFPNRILHLVFPPIDITVFRVGAVYLALAAFIVLAHGNRLDANAGGEAAHLGGAAVGWLLAGHLALLAWADRIVPPQWRMPGHRHQTSRDTPMPKGWKYHDYR
ncbi:MAG: rhomboid family intramembrane serine protease [Planctomycetota bacterium]